MQPDVERLIDLIRSKRSFHGLENKELNALLASLEPQQIPSVYRKHVIDIIDMLLLTNNVYAENRVHIERFHQFLVDNATSC